MCRGQNALKKHTDKEHPIVVGASKRTKDPVCNNGSDCDWLRRGICSYFHPRIGVQKPWLNNKVRQESRTQGGRQEARGQGGRQDSRTQGGRQESRTQGGLQEIWGQGGRQESRTQGGRQESRTQGGRQDSRTQGGRQESRTQGGRQEARGQGGRQESRGQVNIPRRNLIQPDRLDCKFDGRCERIPNCPWIHSLEDFPPLQGGKRNIQRRGH